MPEMGETHPSEVSLDSSFNNSVSQCMLLMKVFIAPSLVRFRASAQCRSVYAESSFRLFSSGLSNRNAEDPVTVDLLSEESLSKEGLHALSSMI